jgi:molybdopterin-guanine dinucleotide biosynthesis protein A
VHFVKRYDQVSAFILCGGASSRMGRDKASLILAGEPLLLRTVHLVEPLVAAVAIVGTSNQIGIPGLRWIDDQDFGGRNERDKSQGPLAGIATALTSSGSAWNLILACDLPYLTGEWLGWFLARAVVSDDQIVMPRTSHGLEPLAAVYRRECGPPIAASLARGIRKVTDALEQFQIEFVFEREWRHIDPDGRVLRNMNTPPDYEEARDWLENPRLSP